MRLVGLSKLKKSNDLILSQTRDLPAYSIVPKPTTLLHAPMNKQILTEASHKLASLSYILLSLEGPLILNVGSECPEGFPQPFQTTVRM